LKTFKIITLLFITILSSCVKEDVDNEFVVEPVKTSNLAISSINPISGPKDTTVTITGTDFSPNITSNKVTINGLECNIISASDKILNVIIPRGAGTGNIVVTVGGNTQQGPVFNYQVTPSVVTTLAGNGMEGYVDGVGTAAQFFFQFGVTVDANDNVFVADSSNKKIRKITPTGLVSTFAGSSEGSTDGNGISAQFKDPFGIKIDLNGNLYVADIDDHRIRKITPTGVVTTLAGSTEGFAEGTGSNAQFKSPRGVAVDASGNVYVADSDNHRIRKINPAGLVTTFAGSGISGSDDGIGTAAQFSGPFDVAVDISGNVYVADFGNYKIRKITPTGVVTTVAGSTVGYADGTGTAAQFDGPRGIIVDTNGNIYVTDNSKIRKITQSGMVTTLAGSTTGGFLDGIGTAAQFRLSGGIAIDKNGNLYVADVFNHSIRKITQD
jgi:sugar lactone lactonase YvrE